MFRDLWLARFSAAQSGTGDRQLARCHRPFEVCRRTDQAAAPAASPIPTASSSRRGVSDARGRHNRQSADRRLSARECGPCKGCNFRFFDAAQTHRLAGRCDPAGARRRCGHRSDPGRQGASRHKDSRGIRDLPQERVIVTGYLSEADMRGLMCASDLHIALRFPSVGETSGTLTRALGLGVPSVVLDHEAFAEFSPDHVVKVPLTADTARGLGDILLDFCANRPRYAERAAAARNWVIEHASLDRSVAVLAEAVRAVGQGRPRASNMFRDLAGELLSCIASQVKDIRLDQPAATPEDFAERLGDALLTNAAAIAILEACRADFVSLVLDPHRDRPSKDLHRYQEQEAETGRVRKAALVVSSVDLQSCNIDYVVEEIGIERFDVLVFILLPASLMSRPMVLGERAFDGRLPNYLRERGTASASLRIALQALTYFNITATELLSEEIEVPLRIIGCEALI